MTHATRRGFLGALGMAATCPFALNAQSADKPPTVTQAPVAGAQGQEDMVSPFGVHQAGIITPRPAFGMVAAFDVLAASPADLKDLFQRLTARIVFLTQGGAVPQLDPKLPPADSGLLGEIIQPNGLTITVSLGESLFSRNDWLAAHKPHHLQRMTRFHNDALDANLCHGDVSIQICANAPDTTIHALRDILRNLPDRLVLRWKQEGNVPVIPPRADGQMESARNLLGFRDGSANPNTSDSALMDRILWIGADDQPWAMGGSYQAVRIIRNFVERWDRTALTEQERVFGRTKSTGAPLDQRNGTETNVPDYAADPEGHLTHLESHIRRANPRDAASAANLMLRRPFNYSNGVTKSGQLDQGLLFIAYQADLNAGFITVQHRLDHEPLEEYIKPVGGGYFITLPGIKDAGDYLGSQLIGQLEQS